MILKPVRFLYKKFLSVRNNISEFTACSLIQKRSSSLSDYMITLSKIVIPARMAGIQTGDAVSPTAFSLLVHNAIGGLFSIVYNNQEEITGIASGQEVMAEELGFFKKALME
jgi:hypothetical protein